MTEVQNFACGMFRMHDGIPDWNFQYHDIGWYPVSDQEETCEKRAEETE